MTVRTLCVRSLMSVPNGGGRRIVLRARDAERLAEHSTRSVERESVYQPNYFPFFQKEQPHEQTHLAGPDSRANDGRGCLCRARRHPRRGRRSDGQRRGRCGRGGISRHLALRRAARRPLQHLCQHQPHRARHLPPPDGAALVLLSLGRGRLDARGWRILGVGGRHNRARDAAAGGRLERRQRLYRAGCGRHLLHPALTGHHRLAISGGRGRRR